LLSHDGRRVVDLTAVGVEDMFDAAAQVARLRRVAAHLVHAPGALAYPTDAVRVLAPLPIARTAWARFEHAGARARGRALAIVGDRSPWDPEYADPVALLGPGGAIETYGRLEALEFGVACVLSGGRPGWAERDPGSGIAGYCGALRWAARTAPGGMTWGAALGPWLVTPEELVDDRAGPIGSDLAVTLAVTLAVNGAERYREASGAGLQQRLAGIVAAAADTFTLRAGDVFCAVRLAAREAGGGLPGPGDDVVLHIERLGALPVRVTAAATDPVAKGE
jgi:hypothetical protein